ncbi:hypothetical protein HPB50_024274 [Hyalomma asiaticum]|uniref:Uncharacterized protein n=1 Tax=Hyalomma asiaticum TaxID=266040 RepID=A0ACB7RYP9_HYAAI|nr:hypothetical protein HPB50_024274 [Hyalomma asiaticum]
MTPAHRTPLFFVQRAPHCLQQTERLPPPGFAARRAGRYVSGIIRTANVVNSDGSGNAFFQAATSSSAECLTGPPPVVGRQHTNEPRPLQLPASSALRRNEAANVAKRSQELTAARWL